MSILNAIFDRIYSEPVYTQGLVTSFLSVLAAMGLGLDGGQVAAVTVLSASFLSWLTRKQVTPISR